MDSGNDFTNIEWYYHNNLFITLALSMSRTHLPSFNRHIIIYERYSFTNAYFLDSGV